MLRRLGRALCCAALALALAAPAAAQDDARQLFTQGQAAYETGDYDTAVRLWLRAYELDPRPLLQYNLAQAYERLGQLDAAVRAYPGYADAPPGDDQRPKNARARLAPPDPAKILFPAVGGGERADTSLGFELTRSANDIVARQVSLSEKAAALSRAIDERLDGETTLITQGLRVLIALFWAFLAVSLIWVSRGGEALWASWLNMVPADDARLLARAFGVIAMAGLAAPFVIAGVVWLLGKGDNNRLRARSADLGREAGELARDFDAELDRLRQAMDGRKENPAAAVIDLSRAHLTALEAAVFFRRLHFLTGADRH